MDLQAFRDVSIRLEPLRRMLADLTSAVELSMQADQQYREASGEVEALGKQIVELRSVLVDLRYQASELLEHVRERKKALQAELKEAEKEHKVSLDTLRASVVQEEKILRDRLSQAESSTLAHLTLMESERKVAEERLRKAQAAHAEFLAQVNPK